MLDSQHMAVAFNGAWFPLAFCTTGLCLHPNSVAEVINIKQATLKFFKTADEIAISI
jgi:hypothetical protein